MQTNWKLRDQPDNTDRIRRIAEQSGLTMTTTSLLYQRGVRDPEHIDKFLNPGLRYLSPLEAWPGLLDAAELLATNIAQKKRITVWGDYDVDGVTATAVVLDFFARKKVPIKALIPSRFEHGYGLDRDEISSLARQGVNVLLTVDCGISDIENIAYAKEQGMTVILTDHHLPGPELPPADAIVNPKISPCPCPDLAGVGVAFLLMAALNHKLPGPPLDIRTLLDLVALGTIADVVPLTGENRTLVKNGLLVLKDSRRTGLQALKKACSLEPDAAIGSGIVGFSLAPRINAAGRLSTATLALDMIMEQDQIVATRLANKINRLNSERKAIEQAIVTQAIDQSQNMEHLAGLVLFNPHWHQGVIGIAASRIVEQRHRPTVLLTQHGEILKGSGRSLPGVHLYNCLKECADLLLGFGGHPMAAGVSLEPENLVAFQDRFAAVIKRQYGQSLLEQAPLLLDAELEFKNITPTLLTELDYLQPFGPGCPRPVFLSPPVTVTKEKIFGQDKHLALDLKDNNTNITLRALAWRQAERYRDHALRGSTLRVAFTPKITLYRGLVSIELTIQEIFPA
ncbi:MAG: single-stranded-DNA-specific exonuclease RecJ [Desulfoplanes sp.]